ncbi:MAG: hypothetical protein KAU89_04550, partial [Candidatus Thorarchaeota archaeon]|nr:hypothetical protein [Candidatus Thorarchaeota archaeon]
NLLINSGFQQLRAMPDRFPKIGLQNHKRRHEKTRRANLPDDKEDVDHMIVDEQVEVPTSDAHAAGQVALVGMTAHSAGVNCLSAASELYQFISLITSLTTACCRKMPMRNLLDCRTVLKLRRSF